MDIETFVKSTNMIKELRYWVVFLWINDKWEIESAFTCPIAAQEAALVSWFRTGEELQYKVIDSELYKSVQCYPSKDKPHQYSYAELVHDECPHCRDNM